jgi:hypothetical protein
MAGVTLGFLKYVLGLDTLTFRKGMTEAERDLVKLQKSFEKKGQAIAGFGKKLTVGLTLPLAAFAAKGVKEAQATAEAMGQVNAAIASMGPVAQRSASQLSGIADALEMNSLFEADEILRKVTANMLTFGNISGQTFDKAQQAAVDLATRLGTDLQSATILVGKALNDPIKGMGALSKAGIQFSASQKETIKAMVEGGNAAGAQAIILKELNRQFGGAAAAAQNTDPWNKLSDAFNQMAEKVGTALLPLIPPLTDALVSVLNAFSSLSPETQKWVLIIGAAAVAIGPLLTAVGSLMTVLAASKTLVLFAAGLSGIGASSGVAATGLTAAGVAVRALLGPIGLAITAITAVYYAYKNWDKIKPIVQAMVTSVADLLRGKLKSTLENTKKNVHDVAETFRSLYDRVVGHSYVPDMVTEIGQHMARLDALLVAPAKAATTKAGEAFRDMQELVKGLLERLFPEAAAFNQFQSDLKALRDGAEAAGLSVDQLREATARLYEQYRQGIPEGPGLPEGFDPGPVADIGAVDLDALDEALSKMGGIRDTTSDWSRMLRDVATDVADITGDWLADLRRARTGLWHRSLAVLGRPAGRSCLTGPISSERRDRKSSCPAAPAGLSATTIAAGCLGVLAGRATGTSTA